MERTQSGLKMIAAAAMAFVVAAVLSLGCTQSAQANESGDVMKDCDVTLTTSAKTTKATSKPVVYTATVKTTNGKPVKGAKVTFTWNNTCAANALEAYMIGGKNHTILKATTTVMTNASGQAQMKMIPLAKGTSRVNASVVYAPKSGSKQTKSKSVNLNVTTYATVGGVQYAITDMSKNTIMYVHGTKAAKSPKVPATVKFKVTGKTYKVNQIATKAFANTNAKTVTIGKNVLPTKVKKCLSNSKVTTVKCATAAQKKVFKNATTVGKKVTVK